MSFPSTSVSSSSIEEIERDLQDPSSSSTAGTSPSSQSKVANHLCGTCGLSLVPPYKIPLFAPYTIHNLEPEKWYYWCSCGLSKTQPFCDNSHKNAKPRTVIIKDKNGIEKEIKVRFKPVRFKVDHSQTMFSLCGCKYTRAPPYCDATHICLPGIPKEPPCKCKYDPKLMDW
jgi:CDGSH-type Zn-finger protein